MTVSTLAQSDLINSAIGDIYAQFGSIAFFLALGVGMIFLVWRNSENAKIDREKSKTETTEAINKIATSQTDELNKVNTEFRQYQMSSEKQLGVFEGRVDELSKLVKHNQDKYEEREKALAEQIATLTKQFNEQQALIEKLQIELNGKNEKLAALEIDNKKLSSDNAEKSIQAVNLQRDKLDLELERDRLQKLVSEQAEKIALLSKQLEEKDKTIFDAPPTVSIETAVNTVNENKSEDKPNDNQL